MDGRNVGYLSVSLNSSDITGLVSDIEETWQKHSPGLPFNFRFLDDDFDAMYKADVRTGNLLGIFSFLAIFIACLGLFALSSYTTERRTKEIGVRKVMGASVSDVVLMLSKDFSRLVLFAFVLGTPIAWYFMNDWLSNFEYRTNLGVEVFIIAGVFSFAISWITISFQSFKAATANPVNSLKSE
jgi:putative ABC transport system permease protein